MSEKEQLSFAYILMELIQFKKVYFENPQQPKSEIANAQNKMMGLLRKELKIDIPSERETSFFMYINYFIDQLNCNQIEEGKLSLLREIHLLNASFLKMESERETTYELKYYQKRNYVEIYRNGEIISACIMESNHVFGEILSDLPQALLLKLKQSLIERKLQ